MTIVAYTGGLMAVPGWGPVGIDLAGIDASAEQIGILADHDATLKGIVGHSKAVIAGGRLLVQGTITPSADVTRQVVELANRLPLPGFGRRHAERLRASAPR